MNKVVIALGSNIEPEKNVRLAKDHISSELKVLKSSEFIKTEPVGKKNQPRFLNGALLVESRRNLENLKDLLRKIEDKIGRKRNNDKFGPRVIDLDVVVWNGNIIDNDVFEREFLQKSIAELLPEIKAIL